MIEGINASVATSPLIRPAVDQVESVSSYAANPNQVQRVAQPPYVTLYVTMNYEMDKAVLQIRDSESAEVLSQIPSDTQIKAYRKAAEHQPAIFEHKADSIEENHDAATSSAHDSASVSSTPGTAASSAGTVSSASTSASGSSDAQASASVLITA